MAITKASAQTTVNSGTQAAAAATVNQITVAPATATTVAGGGTLGGVTISNVSITDSTFANVLSGDTAVSTAGGFVKITGTGFKTAANVFLGSTVLANTFVSATQINANIPATAAGTYQFTVFNTDGSGAIYSPGLTISGPPSWTTTSYSASALTLDIQLFASGDAPLTYYIQPGSANPENLAVNSAGYLSGTVAAEGAYTITVIVDDAQGQSTQADITVTVAVSDVYFNRTTVALPADTTTWVTDASTNAFVLTVNGDTRPSAFSPYKTVWSNSFDGTGDYLTLPSDAAFAFGTGDFTVEGWYYLNAGVTRFCLYDSGNGGNAGQFSIFQDSASGFFVRMTSDISYGSPPGTQAWNHFAVTRSGTTVRLFFNGTQAATGTQSTNITNTTPFIGYLNGFASYLMNGYISNLRVLKGTALYTSNFTPSTSLLTAIANTSLLTCQSNRLIDASTNNFTITKNGDVTVSNFAPFVETDTATASGYFDGSLDSLSIPASSAFAFGTEAYTIEAWFNITGSLASYRTVVSCVSGPKITVMNDGSVRVWHSFTNFQTSVVGLVTTNQWYHIVMVRESTSLVKVYLNGILIITITTGEIATTNYSSNLSVLIGEFGEGYTHYFVGYISNVRIVKGTALYTSAFTPPTAPLTAIANTSLLTLQSRIGENNNRFIDQSNLNHLITRSGNATQGSFSPFSQTGWSNYFDGTGDFLDPGSAILPSTGNWTMELWFYCQDVSTRREIVSQYDGASVGRATLYVNTSAGISFFVGSSGTNVNLPSTTTLSNNTWYHVAVVRDTNTFKLFINGTLEANQTESVSLYTGSNLNIGRRNDNVNYFLGNISNLRIVNGTAVYTSTFTPPTSPLTAITNTSLLTCQSNRLLDNSANNFTITRNGDVSVQAFSPFAPTTEYLPATHGGSGYFDGTGDALTIPGNSAFDFGTGNFTLECFFYVLTASGTQVIFDAWNNSPTRFLVRINVGNLEAYTTYGSIGGGAVTRNQWNHVALVRNGSTTTLYLNGVSVGTPLSSAAGITASTALWTISRAAETFNGYLASLRVVKGTAVYTAAFTPPTAPVTAIANTSLLLNFTNAGIVDATGKNTLETVNQAQLSTAVKKFGSASIVLDGVDDYVVMPYSPLFNLGTGAFTIEGWVYFNVLSGNRIIFDTYTSAALGGGYQLYWRSTGTSITLYGNGVVIAQSSFTGHVTGTWYHIACTRDNSGNVRIFVDGTKYADTPYTTALNIATTARPAVGIQVATLTNDLDGYVDDFRLTVGYARYTATFTPPTATFKLR